MLRAGSEEAQALKVGIISMQRVYNYGSFLQAFALKKLLERDGHNVKFVDIEKNPSFKGESTLEKWRGRLGRMDRYIITRFQHKKLNNHLFRIFPQFQKDMLGFDEKRSTSEGCEGIVIGSDEIFNCESNGFWKITSERFGKVNGAKRVISYAASCGYTSLSDTSEADRKLIEEGMRSIDSISVRDDNSRSFAENFRSDVQCHLDPVMIYDYDQELLAGEKEGIPHEKYMVVYGYANRIRQPAEIRAIKNYAKTHKLKMIAIGGSHPWCDEFAILSPFQVLAYFKNAQCIVTDTFHGTVMAAKYNRPMAVLVRPRNKNKLEDLLRRLHIERHAVRNPSDLESILDMNDDFAACNQVLAEEKERSRQYLHDALKL